jgi:transposase InsO family protein
MVRELDRLKVYFYSAIDVKGKWALSLPYARLSSRNAKDFLEKLQNWHPLPIREVQTDNGAEFEGEFDAYLRSQHIPHHWSYPRCPRINGCIERYQRTLSEEFIQVHQDLVRQPQEFLHRLADYLWFYNAERVNSALGNQTPLSFLLSKGHLSKMPVTYTSACNRAANSV